MGFNRTLVLNRGGRGVKSPANIVNCMGSTMLRGNRIKLFHPMIGAAALNEVAEVTGNPLGFYGDTKWCWNLIRKQHELGACRREAMLNKENCHD